MAKSIDLLLAFDPSRNVEIKAIAERYGRQVECAIIRGNLDMAYASVDQAFRALEESQELLTPESLVSMLLVERTANRLEMEGVFTISHLCQLTREQLLQIRGLGVRAVSQIETDLKKNGYTLSTK